MEKPFLNDSLSDVRGIVTPPEIAQPGYCIKFSGIVINVIIIVIIISYMI
jgi:hypothetical protein